MFPVPILPVTSEATYPTTSLLSPHEWAAPTWFPLANCLILWPFLPPSYSSVLLVVQTENYQGTSLPQELLLTSHLHCTTKLQDSSFRMHSESSPFSTLPPLPHRSSHMSSFLEHLNSKLWSHTLPLSFRPLFVHHSAFFEKIHQAVRPVMPVTWEVKAGVFLVQDLLSLLLELKANLGNSRKPCLKN